MYFFSFFGLWGVISCKFCQIGDPQSETLKTPSELSGFSQNDGDGKQWHGDLPE